MMLRGSVVLLSFISSVLCYAGEYVPKSYYLIDQDGHESDVVYFRSKRAVEFFPLFRMKRGGASSSASSSAHASSGSYSGSGDEFVPGFVKSAFESGFDPEQFVFGPDGPKNFAKNFAGPGSSAFSGTPQQGYTGQGGNEGPTIYSRFGEDTGTGVKIGSSAQGQRGAFSASSSSIDGDGKITYATKSGKY